MQIVAHRVKNHKDAAKAIGAGADFLEVDVSQSALFSKFIIQHNILIGKFGIGPLLESLFIGKTKGRLFLDFKFANSHFANKFNKYIRDIDKGNVKICGRDWKIISNICHLNGFEVFYTIRSKKAWQKLKKSLPYLKKPHGFSIHYSLIDKNLIDEIREAAQNIQIWAWTVNSQKEFQRLENLQIDGIITDNWQHLPV